METDPKPRLLVFVIAYHAEKSLERVLDQIPRSLFEAYFCEILIVDDASTDRTYLIGKEWRARHPEWKMTVLRNEYNQGYGGNQKVGYQYAIHHAYDFVAMIHGDGQYAPEELPRLLEPLRDGKADAVFGSRMLQPGRALKGGMPLYKYVGNRILTAIQNALLHSHLSEFHSGYRIYRVKSLSVLPFQLNSNDFHFDTEIIIQFLNAKLRIVELPIPTYYGDEICYVNGLKYAKDVLRVTAQNIAHKSGILYQRRFDLETDGNKHYSTKVGYPSSHTWPIEAVPAGAKVIDLGAGPGIVAKELAQKGCDVTVVDRHRAPTLPDKVKVILQDLDDPPLFDTSSFSHILLLDVIEHLKRPEEFIAKLRSQFNHDRKIVILTTPNIAFLPMRLMLLFGQFNYGKEGILDLTHTRLFTFRAILRILRDHGFKIRRVRGIPAPFPKALGPGVMAQSALQVNQWLIQMSKSLFAYQIYIEAETTPDVNFVLRDALSRDLPPSK